MPTKIIVTHQGALKKKYGARTAAIRKAVKRLIAADARRGITTTLVFLDGASMGVSRAVTGKPQSFKQAIDHAYQQHRKPDYIAILGGPTIVPHQQMPNPLTGDDAEDDPVVPSDLPYAADAPAGNNVEAFVGPSRAVGRIADLPGDRDPSLLIAQLNLAAKWRPARRADAACFGLSTYQWRKSTAKSLQTIFGGRAKGHVAPEAGPVFTKQELSPVWHFINCHGARVDTRFYGQKGTRFPVAHRALSLPGKITKGTVAAAECCYGAQLFKPDRKARPGIAVTYLAEGAIGFLGSSTVAYGPATVNGQADLICRYFVEAVRKGATLGRALLEARQEYVGDAAPLSPVDLKTLAQFMLLGDPSLRAVAPAAKPTPTSRARLAAAHTARRAALESRAATLTRGVDSIGTQADRPAPQKIVDELAREAVKAGYLPESRARTWDVVASDDLGARSLVRGVSATQVRFHVLSAAAPGPREIRRATAREGAVDSADAADIPTRMLLVGREVGGRLVGVERLFAHGPSGPGRPRSYEGRVTRRRVSRGSKSDHEAVMLESGEECLILRRQGGNAFADPVLDGLVGRRIRGSGRRDGNTLILSDWEDLG